MKKRKISGDDWIIVDRLIYMYQKYDDLYIKTHENLSLKKVLEKLDRSSDIHIIELTEDEWNSIKNLVYQAKNDIETLLDNMRKEEINGQTNS